jgi:hypothetical protein
MIFEIITKILISMTGKTVISATANTYKYRKTLYQRLLYQVFFRNKIIRISCASLLKIEDENKFLLIRNRLRPNFYCPIGGALRYSSSATSFLKEIDFQHDGSHSQINAEKLKRDLRGFIPAKNLFKFIEWYAKSKDREENSLHREIAEEFTEIRLGRLLKYTKGIEFNFLKEITEIPHSVSGKKFLQFRILRIYELSSDFTDLNLLMKNIKIENNPNLIWVTSDEIEQGRDDNHNLIGSNSSYLISNKKILKEDVAWTTKK